MKNPLNILFSPKEASFIGWFVLIFLGSAAVLSLFGLLPSEFSEQSNGQTLSEKLAQEVLGDKVQDPRGSISGSNNQNENPLGLPFSESALGILNNTSSNNQNRSSTTQQNTGPKKTVVGLPTRLIIPSIGVDTKVFIPRSTSIPVLDAELQKGPVYYPGSGTINTGNMFIFGHSTGYAVVINKAYKVFNELKNLTSGDIIYVESEGKRFTYRVRSVDKVDKDETLVTFDTKAHLLTLSTCNSFGSKSDRFVVVAEFVN